MIFSLHLGLLLLRLGLGGVFLWFGVDKFLSPLVWMNWIPAWFLPYLGDSSSLFLYGLGAVEILLGLFVLLGYYSRWAAGGALLLLLGIVASFGLNEIMIRDLGLAFLALGIVALGPGAWSANRR